LIEVLVASVIIMLSLGFCFMFLLKVIYSQKNDIEFQSKLLMNEVARESKEKKNLTNQTMEFDKFIIKKTILTYRNFPDQIKVMNIKAFDFKGRLLSERKELISFK